MTRSRVCRTKGSSSDKIICQTVVPATSNPNESIPKTHSPETAVKGAWIGKAYGWEWYHFTVKLRATEAVTVDPEPLLVREEATLLTQPSYNQLPYFELVVDPK